MKTVPTILSHDKWKQIQNKFLTLELKNSILIMFKTFEGNASWI